jgi:hypothetical protein
MREKRIPDHESESNFLRRRRLTWCDVAIGRYFYPEFHSGIDIQGYIPCAGNAFVA